MTREPRSHRPPPWFGPWPLVPGPTFVLLLMITLLVAVRAGLSVAGPQQCLRGCWTLPEALLPQWGSGVPTGVTLDPILVLVYPLVVSGAAALVLAVMVRWRPVSWLHPTSLPRYIAALLLAALAGSATGAVIIRIVGPSAAPASILVTAFRLLVVLVVVHWVVGRFSYAYRRAAEEAASTVADLTQQRWQIVRADEKARREVAEYLHDHVQADLLVLAMRLRKVADEVGAPADAEVGRIVEELERVRRVGVRGAGQRLSPDVPGMGLLAAVTYLAATWRPAFEVHVSCSEAAEQRLIAGRVDPMVPTAIYRVIEQALLNSAAHGHASRLDIMISLEDDHVGVLVSDNGRGMDLKAPPAAVPGSGTALSSAWMDVVQGTWTRSPLDPGVLVTITVPLAAHPGPKRTSAASRRHRHARRMSMPS